MVSGKISEMTFESIPAGILQMYAFVISPKKSTAAAGSILISGLTTGFASALISYGEFTTCFKFVSSHFVFFV